MEKREPSHTIGGNLKLVQPLWETVEKFLKKIKLELLYDPMITLLDIYQEKMENSNLKTHMHPNVHGSIIITKTWK